MMYRLFYYFSDLHWFTFCNLCHLCFVQSCITMDTAVGKISIHTVDLGEVMGTAYRAYIHLQFLVTAVIAVCQGKVDTFIVSQIHCSADQVRMASLLVTDRITYILDLTTVTEFPESSFQILFLNRVISSVTWQWKLLLTYTVCRIHPQRFRTSYGTVLPAVRRDSLPVYRRLHTDIHLPA